MSAKKFNPIHPGEVLREEFLKPFNITAEILAQKIHVNVESLAAIIAGEQSVTARLMRRCFSLNFSARRRNSGSDYKPITISMWRAIC